MILLVEDNPDDVKLTIRAFKQQRIERNIVVARDGEEALDFLFTRGAFAGRDTGKMPVLILMDLKLPKVDGLEVLKQMRSQALTQFIMVVMLTTSEEEHDIVESYKLGVNSYMRKPVDFEHFSQVIGQLGLYWLRLNLSPGTKKIFS